MRTCLLAALAASALSVPAWAAKCGAESAPRMAALVELYTSEGCSSCPPADRWLATLGKRGAGSGLVVPLALHVDYWDYIGWKDPFARHEFSRRQRELAARRHARLVYTPQVLLQGQDYRAWGAAAFEQQVQRINAQPAKAEIRLELARARADALAVAVRARLLAPSDRMDPALYVASYGRQLVSHVAAGENEGRTLRHDFVVLDWAGPIDFSADGVAVEKRDLALLPGMAAANWGVVAFVQDRHTSAVLQALMLPACPG